MGAGGQWEFRASDRGWCREPAARPQERRGSQGHSPLGPRLSMSFHVSVYEGGRGFPYLLQFQSEFGNKEFMI